MTVRQSRAPGRIQPRRGHCRLQAAIGVCVRGLFLLLLAIAGLCPAPSALAQPQAVQAAALPGVGAAPVATEMRLGVHPDKTRFVMELSRETAFRLVTERDPWRVAIDLPEIAFMPPAMPAGRGLIGRLRREPASSGVRIVLDTTSPVRVAWAEVIPPRDGKPPRFVLDLVQVDATGFVAAVLQGGTAQSALPAVAATPDLRQVQPPARSAAPAAKPQPGPQLAASVALTPRLVPAAVSGMGVAVPVPRAKPTPPSKPLIVLDPGHGGQDPGAIAVTGAKEKDITLAAALELRRQLLATGRYRVAMTRETDVFVRLRDRVANARALGADLFISLHADSIGRKEVRGLSVYTLSEKATDREADMLAQRENRADAIVGMDLSGEADEVVSILINLAQRDTRNQSLRLASLTVREVGKQVKLLPHPQRSAGFAVLTAPDVPSILVEMGYLSHPADAKLLSSAGHRQKLARGLVRAVDDYFGGQIFASRS